MKQSWQATCENFAETYGATPLNPQIAMERDKIRRDWINIVVDRSLGGARFSPTLVDLGPYRWFISKWHWKKSNV